MEQLKNFRLSNLLALTAAGIINAIGVTIFLSPEEPLLYLEKVRVDRGDCCCTTTTAPISPR